MKQIDEADLHCLRAAQGWLELGNPQEANAELDHMAPASRSHPEVLELRWEIYAHEKQWKTCVDIALALMRAAPDREQGWLHHSYALHELRRTKEAYTHLATVAEKFRENWTIPYNLACYCAQLGKLDESKDWFKKALALNTEEARKAGIDDPDLKPLRDSISGTLWDKD